MIRAYTVKDGVLRRFEPSGQEFQALAEQQPWLWVDLAGEGLLAAQGFLEAILGESVDLAKAPTSLSPRFLKGYTQVVFPLAPAEERRHERSFQVVLSPRLLVTLRDEEAAHLVEETAQTLENLAARGPVDLDVAFCRLLDEAIDENEASLEAARDAAEKVEQSAMTVESKEVVQDVAAIASRLNDLHDVLQTQRLLVLDFLEGLLPGIGADRLARSLLLDARHKVERQLDLADRYDHELSGVISLSDLALTLRLTRVMTLLTVMATVLLLPNTVGTILGIPSLPIPPGAWGLVALVLLLSGLVPTWYAYRKGWLKP